MRPIRTKRHPRLQTTYDFNPSAETLAFGAMLTAYKSTHPNDDKIRPSEFVESVKAAFPELYPNGSDDAVGGLESKGAKVPNVRDPPTDGDVIMANTDVPTAGAATNLRGVSAEPAGGVVVDLTNEDSGKRAQSAFDESEQREERRTQSRWDDFEKAMRNLRPGGAFAGGSGSRGGTSRGNGDLGRGGSSGTGRGGSKRLDVLDWDV
jgi:hypothetical protein